MNGFSVPPDVLASFASARANAAPAAEVSRSRKPAQQPWRDVPNRTTTNSRAWCGLAMLAIILMLMTSAGFIVYVVITNNRLDDITRQISELKAAASNAMQRQGVSPHSVLQRQDALPALPAKKTATVSTERPAWASVPTPRWVQFETPLDEAELRLDRDSGVMSAEHAGHKIECNFGGAAPELATEQIEVEFVRNAESGEEYAIVRVLRPAFRGRKCVIEWMET